MVTSNRSTPLHFTNLDILRFLAAFYVLVDHIYGYLIDIYHLPSYLFINTSTATLDNLSDYYKPFHQLIKNGAFGVDLFFLLSGFLITSLLLRERTGNGSIDIKSFYVRRILRIWPLYFFIIGFAFVFARYGTHEEFHAKDIYPHVFFVSNFTMISANSWCAGKLFVLWSICIEEQFYLVIPLLLAFVPIKKLPWVFGGFILVSILTRVYLFQHYQYPWFPIYLHTGSRFDTLAIGCLLGYLNHSGFRIPSKAILRWGLFLWLILALSFVNGFYYDSFRHAVFYKYIFIVPLSILFLDLIQNVLPNLKHPFWKLLNWLGKYSYGIYMYQVFLIVVGSYIANHFFARSLVAFVILSILITVVASIISYEAFERHFLTLKKRFEK